MRLLVPLAFGMAVIVPPQSYLEVVEKAGYSGSYGDFLGLYTMILWAAMRLPTWTAVLRCRTERALGGVGVIVIPVIYLALVRMTLAPWFPSTHALVEDRYNHAVWDHTGTASRCPPCGSASFWTGQGSGGQGSQEGRPLGGGRDS